MYLLHVNGYFARQNWCCRWGGKNMDLVPKTGLRRRRSVRSFDRLKLVGLVGLIGLVWKKKLNVTPKEKEKKKKKTTTYVQLDQPCW